LLAACADAARDAPDTYVVQPQDSLYGIAWRHNLDYRDLARLNNLGTNYGISVGQVLRLDAGALPSRAALPAPPRSWLWPTERSGAPRPMAGGGILLPGQLGQEVRAASAGRVVYTGSGLRGYGNLIILKHGDSVLSAYAYNRELLVREGQDVAMGQVIGHMGLAGQRGPGLYFEIRQNGKSVDPIPYLPK
jgi:lipoprotein NlpD